MAVTDTDITTWKTDFQTADTNTPADGALIGGFLGAQVRNVMSVVRTEAENKAWVRLGAVPTYISATSFSLVGDQTATASVGRRVKASISGSTLYGYILTSAFASNLTTVTIDWDREPLTTFTIASVDSITMSSNFSRLPVGTRVEFTEATVNGDRRIRYVTSASDPTVTFQAGDPFISDLGGTPTFTRVWVPSLGINNTITEVKFGAFTPVLDESGWPCSILTGTAEITLNGTTGPFTVTLPQTQPNATYIVQLQAGGVVSGTPNNNKWTRPLVSTRTTTSFSITLQASSNNAIVRYFYVIARQQ